MRKRPKYEPSFSNDDDDDPGRSLSEVADLQNEVERLNSDLESTTERMEKFQRWYTNACNLLREKTSAIEKLRDDVEYYRDKYHTNRDDKDFLKDEKKDLLTRIEFLESQVSNWKKRYYTLKYSQPATSTAREASRSSHGRHSSPAATSSASKGQKEVVNRNTKARGSSPGDALPHELDNLNPFSGNLDAEGGDLALQYDVHGSDGVSLPADNDDSAIGLDDEDQNSMQRNDLAVANIPQAAHTSADNEAQLMQRIVNATDITERLAVHRPNRPQVPVGTMRVTRDGSYILSLIHI